MHGYARYMHVMLPNISNIVLFNFQFGRLQLYVEEVSLAHISSD